MGGLLWIIGNAAWMTSELLWHGPSTSDKGTQGIYPWYQGPILGANPEICGRGVWYARLILSLGLCLLLMFYAGSVCRFGKKLPVASSTDNSFREDVNAQSMVPAEPLAWGFITKRVYRLVFIGPWIL